MMHFYSGPPMHILSGVDSGWCREKKRAVQLNINAHNVRHQNEEWTPYCLRIAVDKNRLPSPPGTSISGRGRNPGTGRTSHICLDAPPTICPGSMNGVPWASCSARAAGGTIPIMTETPLNGAVTAALAMLLAVSANYRLPDLWHRCPSVPSELPILSRCDDDRSARLNYASGGLCTQS
jgi:hypothetical protein